MIRNSNLDKDQKRSRENHSDGPEHPRARGVLGTPGHVAVEMQRVAYELTRGSRRSMIKTGKGSSVKGLRRCSSHVLSCRSGAQPPPRPRASRLPGSRGPNGVPWCCLLLPAVSTVNPTVRIQLAGFPSISSLCLVYPQPQHQHQHQHPNSTTPTRRRAPADVVGACNLQLAGRVSSIAWRPRRPHMPFSTALTMRNAGP